MERSLKKVFSGSQISLLPLSINSSQINSRRRLLATIQIQSGSLSPEKSKQTSSFDKINLGGSNFSSLAMQRSKSKNSISVTKSSEKLAPIRKRERIMPVHPISGSRLYESDQIPSVVVSISHKSVAGSTFNRLKKQNQDSLMILQNFNSSKSQCLLGVMDGHGTNGNHVSSYIRTNLPKLIEMRTYQDLKSNSNYPLDSTELENLKFSLTECFVKINQDLNTKSGIETEFSGSTSVIVLIRGKQCICCNVGDSRAVVGRVTRSGWVPVQLSRDHKPDLPEERMRIEKCNGRIDFIRDGNGNPLGPPRVWLKNEQIPGLAMSRSIGDKVAAQAGVICVPEIFTHWLENSDKFIIIASDGIWEFISSEECVKIVSNFYFSGRINEACEQLVNIATHRWNKEDGNVDDISVIIALIKVKDQ